MDDYYKNLPHSLRNIADRGKMRLFYIHSLSLLKAIQYNEIYFLKKFQLVLKLLSNVFRRH